MSYVRIAVAAMVTGLLVLTPLERASAQSQSIAELVVMSDDFDTLETALKMAEVTPVLAGEGPFTVFAPTDAAFDKIPDETLDRLLGTEQRLANILKYHVVRGELTASELQGRDYVETLAGERLSVHVMNGEVMVGNATVTQANIQAGNGVVHAIDTVLMPPMQVRK